MVVAFFLFHCKQGRVLGFVQMRAASAQREAEVWESLAYELKEGTSRPVPYAEEEVSIEIFYDFF